MKPGKTARALFFSALLLCASRAFAYQNARIGSNPAMIHSETSEISSVIGVFDPGTIVVISSQPLRGYYRCRTQSGLLGWIAVKDVAGVVPTVPGVSALEPLPQASPGSQESAHSRSSGELPRVSVGGVVGLGFYPNEETTWGLDGGYRFASAWSAGIYLTYANLNTVSSGTGTVSTHFMIAAAELNYFFPDLRGFHIGAKAGLQIETISVSGFSSFGLPDTTTSFAALALGIDAGYDYFIRGGRWFSLGIEGNVLAMVASDTNDAANILVTAKFWF